MTLDQPFIKPVDTQAEEVAAAKMPDDSVSPNLCIRDEMADGSILITGGLGFLGSVVVESILRNCSQVQNVFLLLRGKKSRSAAQRVEQLLCSPLMSKLHDQVAEGGSSNPFCKVVAVEGDLCLPGLGLSEADFQRLLQTVTHVIHCAANLELDADIQKTLRHNYFGTQALMQLSAQMQHLRSFVHVSTYFVANHIRRNSVVPEQLYPLPLELDGGRPVQHDEFVSALMSMETEAANKVALDVMARSNFNSTYAFAKSLSESLVADTPFKPGVQRAIVRPSLIGGLLGDPYPGYISGFGGPGGYNMSYALGFFPGNFSVAFASDYHMDIIPCDVVAAVTIAAAAKASAMAGTAAAEQVPIYHACSAHCHPVSLSVIMDCSARFWTRNPPPMALPFTRYPVIDGEHRPSEWALALGRCVSWCKILACCALLKALGHQKKAIALKNAYTAFSVFNTHRYDRSIRCAVDNAIALRSELSPEERKMWCLVADASVLSWYPYGYTMFAGVRRLMFRQAGEIVGAEGHNFEYKGPAVSPDALGLNDNSGSEASGSLPEAPTAWAVHSTQDCKNDSLKRQTAGKQVAPMKPGGFNTAAGEKEQPSSAFGFEFLDSCGLQSG